MKRDIITGVLPGRRQRGCGCLFLLALVEHEEPLLSRMELRSIVPHDVLITGKSNVHRFPLVTAFMHVVDLNLSDPPVGVVFTNGSSGGRLSCSKGPNSNYV